MTMLFLLGSTWSPPAQLLAAWSSDGGVEITPPQYEASCTARFALEDEASEVAWEETVEDAATAKLEVAPPVTRFAEGAKLLLTFRATCADAEGRILEVTRLPGRLVQLDGDRLVDVEVQRPDGEGTLIAEGAMGAWSESTTRPSPAADDDPTGDAREVTR